MKKLNTLLTILILVFITGCGVNDSDSPSRFGTWRIDSNTHATWLGSQGSQAMKVAFNRVSLDSTTADTTYFFSNDSLHVTITETDSDIIGDFQFRMVVEGMNGDDLSKSNFKTIIAANLNDAFEVVEYGFSAEYNPDVTYFSLGTEFNCASTDNTQEDLLIAFTAYSDTAIPDTMFYYQLDTNGMYEAVRAITCSN